MSCLLFVLPAAFAVQTIGCVTTESKRPTQKSKQQTPKPTAKAMERAQKAFVRGTALVGEGQHEQALPYFVAAAQDYPTWALAHLEEARCRMVLNQGEGVIWPALSRAHQLAPSNPRILYVLGLFHESYGRDAAARRAYRQALELRRSYPDALYRLALLQELSADLPTAYDLFEEAFALDQNHLGAALGAVRLAQQLGKTHRAEKLLRVLIRRYPDNIGYKKQLVAVFSESGQDIKARRLQAKIDRQMAETQRDLRPLRPSRR